MLLINVTFVLSLDYKKGSHRFVSALAHKTPLLFGREDSPQIQQWLKTHDYYLYQLDGVGKPHLYRRVGPHVQGGDNV
ncbi:oxidoreductase, Fe-S subunit [Proteus mirabilis]|uniref:Oxidoreductase, Fe-S subunit n=1 Tax=Proteus mirabilis TaxID=584 RepID=A0A2X2C0I0_PROMI|nr:oxidoreductase, Fe-S subunit [Proteus mirabilis]